MSNNQNQTRRMAALVCQGCSVQTWSSGGWTLPNYTSHGAGTGRFHQGGSQTKTRNQHTDIKILPNQAAQLTNEYRTCKDTRFSVLDKND